MCNFLNSSTIYLGDVFMKFFYAMIWLFPILYMFHDFEEIIIIDAWNKKNSEYLEEIKRKNKYVTYSADNSTASFSAAVLIGFTIITIVTIFSYLFEIYIVWFGLFMAIFIHFFVHILLGIIYKVYVPGMATSIIFIPIFIYLLVKSNIFSMFNVGSILISILSASVISIIILNFLHKLMRIVNI